MPEQRDIFDVRSLAMILTAGPLALLLLFSAIDLSWTRIGQTNTPSKSSVVSENTPKIQPMKNAPDR